MAHPHQEALADLEYLLNLNRYELKYRVTNNGLESRYQPDRFMHMLAGQMGQEQRGWMDVLQTRGERTCTFIRIGKGRRAGGGGSGASLSLFSARAPLLALLPLLKHLAFSQAHFCSQSTTDSRERGAWQRRRRETRLCSDPLFLSSPFLQGPRPGSGEVGLLVGSEGVPDSVLPPAH